MQTQRNPRRPAPERFADLRDGVAAWATPTSYAQHGAPNRQELEAAGARLAWEIAVEIDTGGWPNPDAAYRFAAALDASAELAWLLAETAA